MSYGSSKMSNSLSFSFWVLLESVLFFIFHICLAVFLIFALNWCAVWKFQSVHLVQLFLSNLCAIFGRIPYSLCCCFLLGIWVLIAILFGSYCIHLSLLISESICVLSSHFLPKCHQIIVVLWLAYLFLVFGINAWSEICCVLILWCLLFLVWVHICVLDPHKFHFTNSIVFFFWYILLFFFPDLQNPQFCLRKLFSHIRKFWSSGFCKIEVLGKRQKRNQFKKINRKIMINIIKTVCNPDATTGLTEHWF